MYPAPSTFVTNQPGDAWWWAQRDRQWYVVEYTGFMVTAQMQAMLFAGVPQGSRTWDGVTPRHIRIDGNWGPETMRGLWAYARLSHAPDNLLNFIRAAGAAARITADVLGIGLWYTFHQPRRVDFMVGPVTGGTRTQRTDPALLFDVPLDSIRLRAPNTLPVFLSVPNLPEVGAQRLLVLPTVRAIDAQGRIVTASAPLPTPTPTPPAPPPPGPTTRVLPPRNTMIAVAAGAAILGGGYLLFTGSSRA